MPRPHSSSAQCPHCERPGAAAQPCAQEICIRWGYHCIPSEYLAGRSVRPPIIGKLIDREFLIVDTIGEGGMGEVLLALQLPLFRKVAIKLVKDGRSGRALEKFRDEAHAMGHLRHPNIVSLIKYGSHEERPYFAMEYVAGGQTLKDFVQERIVAGRPLGVDEATHIIAQMFDGLEAAHRLSLIHRDIKLDNVILEAVPGNPRLVRILDFGLAKDIADSDQTSVISGTPIYMAPEQFLGSQLGPWTDVYALGVMIFVMICGRSPLPGKSTTEIKAAKASADYEALLERELSSLSAPMGSFFRQALSRGVTGRFKTIEDMRDGWLRACQGLEPLPTNTIPDMGATGLPIVEAVPPQKTAVLDDLTSNPWHGTVLLDPDARVTGTPSAVEPIAEPSPRRRGLVMAAFAVAALGVAVVALALGGGTSGPKAPPSVGGVQMAQSDGVVERPRATRLPTHSDERSSTTVAAIAPGVATEGMDASAQDQPNDAKATTALSADATQEAAVRDTASTVLDALMLRIETEPAGAVASIEATSCQTPCEVHASPGATVSIALDGYMTREVALTSEVLAESKGELKITMQRPEPKRATTLSARPKAKTENKVPEAPAKPKIDYDAF